MRSRTFIAVRSRSASAATMARSAQRLKAATASRPPPGNSIAASAASMPSRPPAAAITPPLQPSNGTSRSTAMSSVSRRALSSSMPLVSRRLEIDRIARALLVEHEEAQIAHALRIKDAVEMIAFMLHDAGMEAADGAVDHLALDGRAAIADAGPAWHGAAQARHRETALPAELLGVAD